MSYLQIFAYTTLTKKQSNIAENSVSYSKQILGIHPFQFLFVVCVEQIFLFRKIKFETLYNEVLI